MGDSKRKHNNNFELIYPRSYSVLILGLTTQPPSYTRVINLKKSTIIFTVKKSSVIVALNGALICLLEYKTSCADLIFMKIGSDKYMYVRLSSCWPRKQDLNESHHQCSMRVFFFFQRSRKGDTICRLSKTREKTSSLDIPVQYHCRSQNLYITIMDLCVIVRQLPVSRNLSNQRHCLMSQTGSKRV